MANQLGSNPGGVQLGTTPGGPSTIADNTITTAMLQNGSVTTAKLAAEAVTNAKLANSGSTAGRLGAPVLIDETDLAAATTYTATMTAAAFRSLKIICRVSAGMTPGNPITLRMNGDTGANYYRIAKYAQGDNSVNANSASGETAAVLSLSGAAMQETDFELDIDIRKVTSRFKPFRCEWYGISSLGPTTDISGETRGIWGNSGSDVTSVTIGFGAAATGKIEVWGVPT